MEKSGRSLSVWATAALIAVALLISPLAPNVHAKDKVWRLKAQAFTVPGKYDCQWVVAEKFIELVKNHTNDQVLFSLHPSGELVGPREIWTAVSAGTIDAGTTLD
ncbi:MAG: hypothetical protein V2L15_03180, partial [Desulfobacteraceae bacterium]|nr:hypothetical protein [Desulfobacteraceae bacterium]